MIKSPTLPLTELSPTELSIEPIRADSVIRLQGPADILHIEFRRCITEAEIESLRKTCMSFDTTCRRLAEIFSQDFASWLLGYPVPLTELSPTELSIEPIRADSVILLQGRAEIVHIDFRRMPKTMYRCDWRIIAYGCIASFPIRGSIKS